MDLRYWTGKFFIIGFGALGIHYYFKYYGHVSWCITFKIRVESN